MRKSSQRHRVAVNSYDPTLVARREAQIMESLYSRRRATAREVLADLPDPPGYSAVRKMLEILEAKGYVTHERESRRYVYSPAVPREQAGRSVLQRAVATFFEGSVEAAVTALLTEGDTHLSEAKLKRIAAMARRAASEGR